MTRSRLRALRARIAALFASRRRKRLLRGLSRLPEIQRRMYWLHCVEQVPVAVAARRLGISEPEASSALIDALVSLSQI